MNRISKLLTARDILLDVPATSKKRLFEHAALLFENEHRLERQKVFDSLFARERLNSIGNLIKLILKYVGNINKNKPY